MKSVSFFTKLKHCWDSRSVMRFRRSLRQFVSLHWWVERSWKVKVQVLIGLTAILLFVFSLVAWRIYQCEYSKIANNFLRLQLFGPQEIYYPFPQSEAKISECNFCPFHLETRTPYGPILPNVRIKASFQTWEGVPFWSLSDETGSDGTFQLAVPAIQMPDRVKLVIHAEDGSKSSDFTAFLKARPITKSTQNPNDSSSESPFVFEDFPLSSIPLPQIGLTFPLQPSLVIQNRILEDSELNFSILTPSGKNHPVFLAVFQNEMLVACRPFIARGRSRNAVLALPPSARGTLSVFLVDFAISPPRVLQHELVYRLQSHDSEKEVEQLDFLKSFAACLNSPEFREEKQNLEFLPVDVANPSEIADSENTVLLGAADRLLGSSIAPKVTIGPQLTFPELTPLKRLLDRLASVTLSASVSPEESSVPRESMRNLLVQALKIQSTFLTQNLNSPQVQSIYATSLPVVFDSQSIQEENFRNAVQNFRTNTKVRLNGMICIILCSALCLVVMMVMMTILGLPTDWRNWILTFGIVLLALGLSYVISVQSDVDSSKESVRFSIFEGNLERP